MISFLERTNQQKKRKPKTYNQEIEKTSEMLNETVFWDIVDLSIKNTKNLDDQENYLVKNLKTSTKTNYWF